MAYAYGSLLDKRLETGTAGQSRSDFGFRVHELHPVIGMKRLQALADASSTGKASYGTKKRLNRFGYVKQRYEKAKPSLALTDADHAARLGVTVELYRATMERERLARLDQNDRRASYASWTGS